MNDIVKEARFYANDVQHIVRGHLERIQALEQERDSLIEVRDDLIVVANRYAKERDAALEQLRVLKGGM